MATTLKPQAGLTPCDTGARTGGALERTRFYPRQLVTPDDLTQDQVYFREKHKRHNRMLHGWGVVCGACVRRGRGECEVIVEPGYILGPYGDEIVIDREITIDVCSLGTGEQDGCCDGATDSWCSDVRSSCPQGRLYLAVRYDECMTRPVKHPGGGCGCGCDDDACEYTRIRDSFTIAVLRELPAPYTTPMKQPTIATIYPCLQRTARGCPPCPPEPWVVLADIAMGDNCRVRAVDCFAHRRHVVTFAEFFWACPPRAGVTTGVATMPPNTISTAHVMASLGGAASIVDVQSALSTEAPRATVTMRRADGSAVAVPAYFEVKAGETFGDFMNREGDRELYDPATGQTLALRTLYASAKVPASQPLVNSAATLALLEGIALPGESSPEEDEGGSRDPLADLIDRGALDRLRAEAGDTHAAARLDAGSLQGVDASSALGKRLKGMKIADVAALTEDELVKTTTEGLKGRQKTDAEAQARSAWQSARKVIDAIEAE
ncbi:MAG: hypothetical protein H7066_04585 [Cytophagaceae bacterium]|nr:hypothetical protein [Gemmatimonadaceae bacterium]